MKKTDIVIGQEYLVSSSQTWQGSTFRNVRVKVLDFGWEASRSFGYRQQETKRHTLADGTRVSLPTYLRPHSSGVLVSVLDDEQKHTRYAVYALSTIRAPYAEGVKIQDDTAKAAKKSRQERDRKEADKAARQQILSDRMAAQGVKGTFTPWGEFAINGESVIALLDRLEA